jgi:hypothetical protein
MVGDQEQYASAFALMARSLGYPARVVMGFAPKLGAAGQPVSVKATDVTAWVEVAFQGVGWIAFDPTPTASNQPTVQPSQPKTQALPQVRQPPRTNGNQNDLVSPTEINKTKRAPKGFVLPEWVVPVSMGVGIPLSAYFIPFLIIAAIKRRRRRRRRHSGSGDRQAAGAWEELTDAYAELGYRAPRTATRLQSALVFEEQLRERLEARERERNDVAGVPHKNDARLLLTGLREFAVATDAAVFSGNEVSPETLDRLWSELTPAEDAARRSVSWVRRRISSFRVRSRVDVAAVVASRIVTARPARLTRGAAAR